ncbi:hypothetical protein AC230_23655 [Streptomyces caatingaensis]|uniref:Uncharacterized protein n=1 Tax=Streptomyces caatingaensis TaxID=1678637 RepID=A0A0K9X9L5_9ACTN|nr:hypothetical protein AC230_23655 [Streptomyces caatingaensis]
MRPTIVLLSPPQDHQRIAMRIQNAGIYTQGATSDRLDRGEYRFGVDTSEGVLRGFDKDELDEISHRFDGGFQAILLEYSGVRCIRGLLRAILQGASGLLDTNYGELVEYEEVLARFLREPLWDWRSTAAG